MLPLGALCSRSSVGSAVSIRAKAPPVPGAGVDIEIPESNYPPELPFGLLTPSHLQVFAEPTAFDALMTPHSGCTPCLSPASQQGSPHSISGDNVHYLLQITLLGVTKPSMSGDSKRKDTKKSLPIQKSLQIHYLLSEIYDWIIASWSPSLLPNLSCYLILHLMALKSTLFDLGHFGSINTFYQFIQPRWIL